MKFYTSVALRGNTIYYRGYSNGVREQFKDSFTPTLYVKSNKQTEYKNIQGDYVSPIQPGSIDDCKKFVEQYQGVSDFEIFGNTGWIYQYISSLYPNHDDAKYDFSKIKIATIDIEVESENGFSETIDASEKINVITLSCGGHKWVLAINNFSLPHSDQITQKVYQSESEMLTDFYSILNTIDADVFTGWSIRSYDVPYIINRTKVLFPEERLENNFSPWKVIKNEQVEIRGRMVDTYKILGVSILDYYELYRKYTFVQQENYKLDHIAFIELGKRKKDYSQYESIKDFYKSDFQGFVEYNVIDVELVEELDRKLNLLELHISMAYLAKVNMDDVYSPVRTWDMIIYNHLLKSNTVIPLKHDNVKDSQYAGAYVKEPVPGMYNWVVSYDVSSLYPTLIQELNIGPDTVVDSHKIDVSVDRLLNKEVDLSELQSLNYSMGANGVCFTRNTKGFLAELVGEMYKNRINAKNKYNDLKKICESDPSQKDTLKNDMARYKVLQMALKICMNSLYGKIGNSYSRYYDIRQAEAITLTGQFAIRWIQKYINEYFNKILKTNNKDYVIASDTDSCFINFSKFVESFCQQKSKTETLDYICKFCTEVLSPYIDRRFKELSSYLNCYEPKLEMKRDVVADRAVWKAKKMYCMNVLDSEEIRLKNAELKIMGMESQRSSTPRICRDYLKNSIKIILTKSEKDLIDYVSSIKDEFYKAAPEDIAFPRGVNNLKEYSDDNLIYSKGTPIAVRGALVYNYNIDRLKLNKKYTKIQEADKIKFLYLKVPNRVNSNVISFMGKIPKEFDLSRCVDYDTQFEKTFLEPLKSILHVIKWNYEPVNTLDAFFV